MDFKKFLSKLFWFIINFLANLFQVFGLNDLCLKLFPYDGASIVFYHDITAEKFESHIKFLKKRYTIVALTDVFDFVSGRNEHLKNSIAITFDDGLMSNYEEVFPILKKYGVEATIFLVSDYIGTKNELWWIRLENIRQKANKMGVDVIDEQSLKLIPDAEKNKILDELSIKYQYLGGEILCLNITQILEMKESGFVKFGSHTKTHPSLVRLPLEKIQDELITSKKKLESIIGSPINILSYPNGDYNADVISYSIEAGYHGAVTVFPNKINSKSNPFLLGRVNGSNNLSLINMQCSGVWDFFSLDKVIRRWHRGRDVGI